MSAISVKVMQGAIVHGRCRAGAGEQISFGSGSDDVEFPGARLRSTVGRLRVGAEHWAVENTSESVPVVAENRADGHDFIKVRPGAVVPIPFVSSRILVLAPIGVFGFLVRSETSAERGHEHSLQEPCPPLLDEQAKYFRVLVALCEPALTCGTVAAIPTYAQIARRLRALQPCAHMTVTHVQHHLNYLLTSKLAAHLSAYSSLREPAGGKIAWSQRAALVELVLRFNLVTPRHLALLEPLGR